MNVVDMNVTMYEWMTEWIKVDAMQMTTQVVGQNDEPFM